ncbi:MAG: hypothetical protein J0H83_09080 [Candidatus Melainabacteria bacterium]|nr:hypothetical protein [Candidatus Melainabacteria bacterium]
MIASRKFRSTPFRDSSETWAAIVQLLTHTNQEAKRELELVAGTASSCIADQATKTAPIIITCEGPRTRIYCLYDDDALDQSDFNETVLGFDPLKGEWSVSLPCTKEDLTWVQASLLKHSSRVTARDLSLGISDEEQTTASAAGGLTLNAKGFLGQ